MKSKIYKIVFLALFCALSFNVYSQESFPNKEERIYSLSKIWKELENSFVYPETLHKVKLDSLYQAYLPLVEKAKDSYEYYRTLSAFMSNFNEAHTRIIPPEQKPYDMPPIEMSNIGDIVYVKNVSQELSEKIPMFSRITSVNKVPVQQYLEKEIYPYISAANTHWKRDKAVTEMLNGRPGSKVTISIVTPDNKSIDVTLKRNYLANKDKFLMKDSVVMPPLDIRYLEGDIAYIHLSTCAASELESIQRTFLNNLYYLLNCKGLIVDVRGNRGGTDQAWYLLAYCSLPYDEFRSKGKYMARKNNAVYRDMGADYEQYREYYLGTAMEEVEYDAHHNNVPDSMKLKQPMVILTGQYVGSAAEDFVQIMKEHNRATVIGEPTVGCLSGPTFLKLPGGYTAMVCVQSYIPENDVDVNTTGILPDIEVKQNFDNFIHGQDDQLLAALELLREKIQ